MASKTIADIYGLVPVTPYVSGKAVPVPNPCPNLLYGLELEIENCDPEWCTAGWTATEDNSLRNNGWEFVGKPMSFSVQYHALQTFFNKNKPKRIEDDHGMPTIDSNYSDRTSIHVHTNCQNITTEQLTSICLLYQVFEKLLFRYIGNDRDKNIFCVPWHETQLSYRIINFLEKGDVLPVRRWQKYTALNLLPLQEKGTIEWRHMHGNADLEFIANWLKLIGRIYAFALAMPIKDIKSMFVNLNTSSMYNRSMDMVFGAEADLLRVAGFEHILEEGVLEMKYSLLDLDKKKKNPFEIPPHLRVDMVNDFIDAAARGQEAVEFLQPAAAQRRGQRVREQPIADNIRNIQARALGEQIRRNAQAVQMPPALDAPGVAVNWFNLEAAPRNEDGQ